MTMYPTEFVKTQLQLDARTAKPVFKGPWDVLQQTVRTKGVLGLYRGLSSLVIGSFMKTGTRFTAFNQFKRLLEDEKGKLTASRSAMCGVATGIAEAAIAVTPMETVKTKMIHDQGKKYKGLVQGVSTMIREEGLRGVYQGLVPTMARQGANSAVRFTVYETCKDWILAMQPGKKDLTFFESIGAGLVAGVVNVYATMPLDVVKTRMQGLDASKYRHTLHCVQSIFAQEGLLAFWTGSIPRLCRVGLAGGIVFASYEQVVRLLNLVWEEKEN